MNLLGMIIVAQFALSIGARAETPFSYVTDQEEQALAKKTPEAPSKPAKEPRAAVADPKEAQIEKDPLKDWQPDNTDKFETNLFKKGTNREVAKEKAEKLKYQKRFKGSSSANEFAPIEIRVKKSTKRRSQTGRPYRSVVGSR